MHVLVFKNVHTTILRKCNSGMCYSTDMHYQTKINLISQHSSECSGILQDSGYYTQSNTQSLSDTAQLPSLLPKTRSKQPATKSYSQSKRTKKVYITKNYCNNYYMDSTSMKNVRLPSTEEAKVKNNYKYMYV